MQIKRDFIGMFDVLKGILMLLVVLVHQAGFSDRVVELHTAAVLQEMMRYGVVPMALFFIASGYTMRREEDVKGYVKRQARQLLLPYLLLMCVCAGLRGALFLAMGRFRIQEISTVVLGFLYGAVQSFELFGEIWVAEVGAAWVLPTLFFRGLFRQLLWRIKEDRRPTICLWLLVIAAVTFPETERFQIPWLLVQSCTALGYLEVGQQLRKRKALFRRLPVPFVLAAVVCWFLMHRYSSAQMHANNWAFWMLDYLTAAAFSVVLLRLYLRTGLAAARFTGLLSYIGRYSLYFLLVHGGEMVIIPWDMSLREPLRSLPVSGELLFWVLFLLRVAFALVGCAAIVRIQRYLAQNAALQRNLSKEDNK